MNSALHLHIANRIYEVVVAPLTTYRTWGFYLHNPEFKGEDELKNKLFVIWYCSLIDTAEASKRFLPDAVRDAEKENFSILAENGRELDKFCLISADFASQFTADEQLWLNDLRNQWVHGYYAARYRDIINSKYIEGVSIKMRHLSKQEYDATMQRFFENGKSIDENLELMRKKAFETPHHYWSAMNTFHRDDQTLYHMLRNDLPIKITIPSNLIRSA